jgi:formate hydrogenlyase transcriptional activator
VERAVILTDGEVLRFHGVDAHTALEPAFTLRESLLDSERRRIEEALQQALGKVSGPDGAAARLRLPSTTLESKIRRLGIDKYHYRSISHRRSHEES